MSATSSASLLGGIFDITRGDLENATFPLDSAPSLLSGLATVRVTRLSEFWKNGNADGGGSLLQSTEGLIRGFFGQKCAWTLALLGLEKEIQCWFGTDPDELDRASLESLLRSSFPDARLSADQFDLTSVAGLTKGVVLTGTPSAKSHVDDNDRRDPLGQLSRALIGSRWLYIVSAEPVQPFETVRGINDIADKIKDTRANHLLRASPIDEENRTARRYVDLLESKLKRYEAGRISGMWDVHCVCYSDTQRVADRAGQVLESGYSGEESVPVPVRVRPCSESAGSARLPEPLTTSEAASLAQMPREEFPGFELVEPARFGVEPSGAKRDNAVQIGEIVDRGTRTGNWLHVGRDELTKHGLVVGITGSGKTNSCQWLLDQVWNDGKGVAFLVIESAKSEYRDLLRNPRFRGLSVFTVGDETISPLRLNPFEVPAGILVQTHLDYLKSLFAAAFVLYPPMPYVLEQALQEIYEDRGWDTARNTNSRGADSPRCAPILDDLAAKIPVVVDRMGYDQRISMDVKAGLLARVNQLRLAGGKGLMFNTRASVDESALFERPCVLELKQLVSDDEKAFVIGLLLIRLYEHHEARRDRPAGLAHVTLIEEAHRLLRNVSTEQGSEVSANPRGRAVEVFANILSEIRSFGEGILVAEQIPAKLAPDVVKNTGFKLIHRLVAPDDRSLMGRVVNLDEAQCRRLATLATGEGVVWTEHTAKAVLVQVPPSQVSKASRATDDMLRSQNRATAAADNLRLLPFEACRSCSASASRACGNQSRGPWAPPVEHAFQRAFNAVRLCAPAISPTFEEFRHLVRRDSRSSDSTRTLCTFISIAETEIERRGEFREWPFKDVDALISFLCKIGGAVLNALESDVAPAVSDEALRPFHTTCQELHGATSWPFPGCRHCGSRCSYRFDMARLEPALSRDFRKSFLDVSAPNDRLPRLARAAATRSYSVADPASVAGAAFCFIVQQLASPALNLATYHQFQMATLLRTQLAARR